MTTTAHNRPSTASEAEVPYWALKEVPPFPGVAMRVLASLGEDDFRKVVQYLQADASLSAEMLRRANSALYGLRCEVRSVQHAVLVLGLDQVRALALAVGVGGYLRKAMTFPALRRCWRHSIATALVMEEIARASGFQPDQEYTAGLLHDLGLFGLVVSHPEDYAAMLEENEALPYELFAAEEALFEVNHCKAGAYLADRWHFPTEIREVALRHHERPEGRNPDLPGRVYWASRLADSLGFGLMVWQDGEDYDQVRRELPTVLQKGIPPEKAEFAARIGPRVHGLE